MMILGLVMAKHEGHAYKILENLQEEYVLDSFELDGNVDPSITDIEVGYDAYVNNEGYLTLERDMDDFISRFIPEPYGSYHLFGFTAEYAEV